jgi:hypothetical protein
MVVVWTSPLTKRKLFLFEPLQSLSFVASIPISTVDIYIDKLHQMPYVYFYYLHLHASKEYIIGAFSVSWSCAVIVFGSTIKDPCK